MDEIKSFEDLDIDHEYNSNRNFVYADFFNKILPHCNTYSRFGGVFSGEKFVQCAQGLQDFIKENNGTMKLAIIPVFDEKDKEVFSESSREQIITEKWKIELDQIKDQLKQDHIKALAWMIVTGKLEIKLILPQDENGIPLTREQLKKEEFLVDEVGIFTNKHGEALSFHGHIDAKKDESDVIRITTSRQGVSREEKQLDIDYNKFGKFWDNDTYEIGNITCQIQPLTTELIDYFRESAPEKPPESLFVPPTLRDYQDEAIQKWQENGNRGIFEMATGTGKTFTAIGCIDKLRKEHKKLFVVIAAPYINLVDQWQGELKKWNIPSIKLEEGWTGILRGEIRSINRTEESQLTVVICTHHKFSTDELIKNIQKCEAKTLLIVDEAHHVGAGNTLDDVEKLVAENKDIEVIISNLEQITQGARKGLSEKYDYRLALSATIERHFDPEGTNYIREYFSGTKIDSEGKPLSTVINFDLKRAINECSNCKESKEKCCCGDFKGYLCGYYYHPYFVELTAEEFDEYKMYTHRAMPFLNSHDKAKKAIGQNILIRRSKIIRDAVQKMPVFIEIMKSFSKIRHLLVFYSENQYDEVDEILKNSQETLGYSRPVFKKITHDSPKDKRKRKKYLRDFANEDYHMILANKVLDEGMDVPEAKSCIILASTGNPTQFIQRRGRVLRHYDNQYLDGTKKIHADIYDVLVRPNLEGFDDPEAHKLEIGMIRSQLQRITEMADLAINNEELNDEEKGKIKEFKNNLPEDVFEKIQEE